MLTNVQTILDAPVKMQPVHYSSRSYQPTSRSTFGAHRPHLSFTTDIVNTSGRMIYIIDQSNMIYVIKPTEQDVDGQILFRKRRSIHYMQPYPQSAAKSHAFAERMGQITEESQAMERMASARLSPSIADDQERSFYTEFSMDIKAMIANGPIYHLETDLVISLTDEMISHPNSRYSRNHMTSQPVVTLPKTAGMTIEIIDNHNQYGPRYVFMGGQIVEVHPQRDVSREHGVHVTTMSVNEDKVSKPVTECVTMEEAKEKYGLYPTHEEAMNFGRADLAHAREIEMLKQQAKREEIHYQQELLKARRENEAAEASFKAQQRQQEIEHNNLKRELEILIATQSAAQAASERAESLLFKREAQASDRKHEVETKKTKDHFETRAAVRNDTSSFFKSIPGMVTGVVALVAVGASLGKWMSSGSSIAGLVGGVTGGSALTAVAGAIMDAPVASAVTSTVASVGQVAGSLVSGVVDAVGSVVSGVGSAIGSVCSSVGSFVSSWF